MAVPEADQVELSAIAQVLASDMREELLTLLREIFERNALAKRVREALYGHAAHEIVEDAKKHDAGVSSWARGAGSDIAGLVLGSTAHKVIHLTDRPVLVVR